MTMTFNSIFMFTCLNLPILHTLLAPLLPLFFHFLNFSSSFLSYLFFVAPSVPLFFALSFLLPTLLLPPP